MWDETKLGRRKEKVIGVPISAVVVKSDTSAIKKVEVTDENKDKIREKQKILFTCECGSILTIQHKSRHEKSQKHIKNTIKVYCCSNYSFAYVGSHCRSRI